jgi:tetratricopeptide (TPR) repeat protein
MVADWGNAVGNGDEAGSLLASLNLSRPRWPSSVPVPVVLWLPEHIMGMMIRGAPDFLDWRSDTCRFPDLAPRGLSTFDLIETAAPMDWGTPVELARERIRELESRLSAHAHAEDPVTRAARVAWLGELGRRLRLVGKPKEAVAALREAIQEARSVHAPQSAETARILGNLSIVLGDTGRSDEAVEMAKETVATFRKLLADRPDAFLPDLALSLDNLANSLSAAGRREDALQVAAEVVTTYRKLLTVLPNIFLPDLAGSLNNLAGRLIGVGRRDDAMRVCQEALGIQRELVEAQPTVFAVDLARYLGRACTVHRACGQHREAAAAAEEGVRMLRPFFERLPDALGVLIGTLCREYLESAKAAGIEPDEKLVGPILVGLAKRKKDSDGG